MIFGSREDGVRAFSETGRICENIVVSVSGLEAASRLQKRHGIPYTCLNPIALRQVLQNLADVNVEGSRILVIHEQITANTCRSRLTELGAAKVDVASWFMMKEALMKEGDRRLREEDDLAALLQECSYDMIIADPVMESLVRRCFEGVFVSYPHFAVSGKA